MNSNFKFVQILFFCIFSSAALSYGEDAVPNPTPRPSPAPIPLASDNISFHGVLKQIDVVGNKAVAEISGDVSKMRVGSQLVALQDGRDCFFSVTSMSGNILQLDIFRCPFLESLKVGQSLEPSLFETPNPTPRPDWVSYRHKNEREDRLRLAVVPYYGFGSSLDSNNLCYNQSGLPTTYGSGSLMMNTAPGVAVEVYDTPTDGFGWSGGMSYDFQRTVTGLNAYAGNVYIGGSFFSPQATLSILTVYGNLVYRLSDFYFPFGINYAFPSFQGGGNSFGNTVITSGFGLQIGAGYIINDHLALEFWMQNLVFDGNTTNPSGTVDYNGLSFINPLLRLRFSF